MPTTTDIKRQPLSMVALRKSPKETPEEFERRTQQFNDFREFKMRNFPRINLVLPEEPLLLTDIVKFTATPCNQQRRQFRPQIIFTKGPFASSTATDTEATATANATGAAVTAADSSTSSVTPELKATAIGTRVTATATDASTSPVASELTASAASAVRSSELNDEELEKKLQGRNHEIDLSKYLITQKTHVDFSQYLIQTPRHHEADADTEKMAAGFIQDLLDKLEICDENGNNECKNESSETGTKATKFQRFRRSFKSLKPRIVRAMTPLTSCFSFRSIHTAD